MPLVLGILFSNYELSVSYLVFKTNLLISALFIILSVSFFTALLRLLKSTGTGTNLPISHLSISVFRLDKFVFNTKFEVSTCEIFLISAFVA